MIRTTYDEEFMKTHNPFLVKNNTAEFYNHADPMRTVQGTKLIARSHRDIDMKSVYDNYVPQPEEISEYYVSLSNIDTVFNHPSTKPIVRSDRDDQYNNLYNTIASNSNNMAEFYTTECSSCNTPSNFSTLDHTWIPGYYDQNVNQMNNDVNYNEKAMTGKTTGNVQGNSKGCNGCGGCSNGKTRVVENFNWTPANVKLTYQDPENIYSYYI